MFVSAAANVNCILTEHEDFNSGAQKHEFYYPVQQTNPLLFKPVPLHMIHTAHFQIYVLTHIHTVPRSHQAGMQDAGLIPGEGKQTENRPDDTGAATSLSLTQTLRHRAPCAMNRFIHSDISHLSQWVKHISAESSEHTVLQWGEETQARLNKKVRQLTGVRLAEEKTVFYRIWHFHH